MPSINPSFSNIPVIYTKNITEAVKSDNSVINLARGDSEFITPLPCINYLKEIIADEGDLTNINSPVGKWTHYEKESGSDNLKRAIIQKYESQSDVTLSPNNILITHGGMNAIFYSLSVILEPGDEIIVFDPAYIAYYPIVEYILKNTKVRWITLSQENNFSIDFSMLAKQITSKTKAILFTSPYNPCGKVFSFEEIQELYNFCTAHSLFLIHDENHELEIYDDNKHYPAMKFDPKKERVILLNSMSRWGMGGWRVGWMIAGEEIITSATRLHAFVNMTCNTFAQEVSAFAIQNYAKLGLDTMFLQYRNKRDVLVEFLNKIDGLECLVPQGTCYAFPNIATFYIRHQSKMRHFIAESNWYTSLGSDKKEKEDELIGKYKSYVVYLYILLKCKVGVIPGCCYGDGGDSHIRLSFSVKHEAVLEAINRMSILLM